jgi:hypothetical protein
MAKAKRYWLWIDAKPGVLPHDLPGEIDRAGFIIGRSAGTWSTALSYLRDYMRAGFLVTIYEVDE